MNLVGYIRVSTEDQRFGMEAQERAIKTECEHKGWTLVDVYQDRLSGRSMARPGLAGALEAIKSGQAEGLIVSKLDRLSRSILDFANLVAQAREEGWNIVALDLGVDLSTPAGEFMATVMAAMAQWERRIIGQRTKDGLAAAVASGVRLGRPSVVPLDVLETIREKQHAGMTPTQIARELNQAGVPTAHGGAAWYHTTVKKILCTSSSS
jgi:DNA invertase Pin-like site-specific DNA recombinase